MKAEMETRTGHTPAPWEVVDGGEWAGSITVRASSDRGEIIAAVNKKKPGPDPFVGCGGDPEANARLIASAPELLEAAEKAARNLPEIPGSGDPRTIQETCDDLARILRDAIAKATGGTE